MGAGFNSFARDLDDHKLKELGLSTRPAKYPWMIHSERNAVSNCHHKEEGMVAYVTGKCCHDCLQHLWQNYVETVYCLDRDSVMLNEEQEKLSSDFIEFTKFKNPEGMKVVLVKPDLSIALEIASDLQRLGFIQHELDVMGNATR